MVGVRDYSPTAASNLSVGGISIAEGWLPASVNNAARASMADLANLLLDMGGETATTGSANAYLLSLPTAPTAYADNMMFVCKLNHAVTGAATININGLGVKSLKKIQDGVATELANGDYPAGHRAMCIYSTADNAVLLLNSPPTFTNTGTGAVARPITDRLADTVHLLDYIPVAEHAAIMAGTSTYDASTAMENAIASVAVDSGLTTLAGPEIILPSGKVHFDSPIQLKQTVILKGHGTGQEGAYGTILEFAADTHGIIVHRYNTIDETVEGPTTTGGDGSTLRDFNIVSLGGTTGHGIWCRARTYIDNVRIRIFPEDGLHIYAAAGSGGITEGNANNCHFSQMRISGCGGNGILIRGADANACFFDHIDVTGCTGHGIDDQSFLGNTYIMPHIRDCGSGGQVSHGGNRYYTIDAANGHLFEPGVTADWEDVWVSVGAGGVHPQYPAWSGAATYTLGYAIRTTSNNAIGLILGVYLETSQPPCFFTSPWIVIGSGVDVADASTGFRMSSGTAEGSMTPFHMPSRLGGPVEYQLAFNRVDDEAITVQADGDSAAGLALALWDNANGVWATRWARGGNTPIRYTTGLSTGVTCGRGTAIGGGQVVFGQGFWVGDSVTNARKVTNGTAVPATGEWAVGDIVFNRAPSIGEPLSWICIAAGTPGTWAMTAPLVAA